MSSLLCLVTDTNPFPVLPKDGEILNTESLGLSDYCDTYEISVKLPDGTIERFFQKVG